MASTEAILDAAARDAAVLHSPLKKTASGDKTEGSIRLASLNDDGTRSSNPDTEMEGGTLDVDGDEVHIISLEPSDPEHPYQWPHWRTSLNCFLISCMTFLNPLASSMFAPGVPQAMAEFQSTSLELAAFVVSVYVLGFASGPLVMAPLSELYGRLLVYHFSNLGFIAFTVACALAPSMNALVVFRFFCGVFGSCTVSNGGASVGDMVPQERRAAAMAGLTFGPVIGPIVGPIAGGFLTEARGWRWNFWVLAIVSGVVSIAMLFSMRESYHPVILARKVARLRRETGNPAIRSKFDVGLSPSDHIKRSIIRPLKLLFLSPIVMIMSLFVAMTYGYLYLMFTTMTDVFQRRYGFSTSLVGLAFLGLGLGSMAGLVLFSATSDRHVRRKAAQADPDAAAEATPGVAQQGMKPEYRLPLVPFATLLLPIGLFLYGWTAEYRIHWIVPMIATAFIGVGSIIIFMAIQIYLVDAYTIYAASALAANAVVRSTAGAVLPLAGLPMFERLGLGWGNSLLGFIAAAFVPVTFLIIRYGETLRNRFPVKNL